jgi:hypothetical protein
MSKNGISYLIYVIRLNKGEAFHVTVAFLGIVFSVLSHGHADLLSKVDIMPAPVKDTIAKIDISSFALSTGAAIWFGLTIIYSVYFGFLREYRKFRKKRCSTAPPDKKMLSKIENIVPNATDKKLKYEIVKVSINRKENKSENVLYSKHIDSIRVRYGVRPVIL